MEGLKQAIQYHHKDFPPPKDVVHGEQIFVSYSQYSTYKQCPKRWKINYLDKVKVYTSGIHAIFGEAIHEILQLYVKTLYLDKIKNADALNFEELLKTALRDKYVAQVAKDNGVHFSTKEELTELYIQGLEMLKYIRSKRKLYFSPKQEELIGIELPLILPISEKNNKVYLYAYLDFVIRERDSGKIIIKDFKTSTKGWSEYEKKSSKANQLTLYKYYFHKTYGVPLDMIAIEYLIFRRVIENGTAWPSKRVQLFVPSNGIPSVNRVNLDFMNFIGNCFTGNDYNLGGNYAAAPGQNNYNCKFCPYDSTCDKK